MKNISDILMLLTSYTIMLLMFTVINRIRPGIIMYDTPQQNNFKLFTYLHATSIVIMLLPMWLIKPLPVFLLSFPDKITIGEAAVFLICFAAIGFFPWKKFTDRNKRGSSVFPPTVHIILYAFLRVVFLVVYEWFFRGLLLTGFSVWTGIGWAVIGNVLLYAVVHTHKTKKEMIGCIPFGLLLCVFTIWWQSIWPAVIFHLEVAIINEWPPLQQFISPQKQTAL